MPHKQSRPRPAIWHINEWLSTQDRALSELDDSIKQIEIDHAYSDVLHDFSIAFDMKSVHDPQPGVPYTLGFTHSKTVQKGRQTRKVRTKEERPLLDFDRPVVCASSIHPKEEQILFQQLSAIQGGISHFQLLLALQLRAYMHLEQKTQSEVAESCGLDVNLFAHWLETAGRGEPIDLTEELMQSVVNWLISAGACTSDLIMSNVHMCLFPDDPCSMSNAELERFLNSYDKQQIWGCFVLAKEMDFDLKRLKAIVNGQSLRGNERNNVIEWIEWRKRLLARGGQCDVDQDLLFSAEKNDEWKQKLREFQTVLAEEEPGVFWPAIVLRHVEDRLLIHYRNFSMEWNEWVDIDSPRVQPLPPNTDTREILEDHVKSLKEAVREMILVKHVSAKDFAQACKWKTQNLEHWLASRGNLPKKYLGALIRTLRQYSALYGLGLDVLTEEFELEAQASSSAVGSSNTKKSTSKKKKKSKGGKKARKRTRNETNTDEDSEKPPKKKRRVDEKP